MKLYYAEVLNPRKVCALAKYIGAPITYIHVDLSKGTHLAPAFRALNPNAKVPVLEDGDRVLWESDAIMCHLALRMGSDLWPQDDRQVDVIRWLSWNQVHFQPLEARFISSTSSRRSSASAAPTSQTRGHGETVPHLRQGP